MNGRKKHIFDRTGMTPEMEAQADRIQQYLEEMGEELDPSSVEDMMADIEGVLGTARTLPANSGVMGTAALEPTLNFQVAPDEHQVGPGGNSAIVFGRDRPATTASGWGAKGANRCNAIDIVAGRMSSARGGDGPIDGAAINPSFVNDAARIYVSQQTDIDLNFGLVAGVNGDPFGYLSGKSAVGIKADGVRVIGRLGVKIVTGKSFAFKAGPKGELDSTGGKISSPAPPIELIAGNNDSTQSFAGTEWFPEQTVKNLQGIGKGENIRDCMRDLYSLMDEMRGIQYNQAQALIAMNSVIGINWWMPHYGPMAGLYGVYACAAILTSSWQARINQVMWWLNYCFPFGRKYVQSNNVYST